MPSFEFRENRFEGIVYCQQMGDRASRSDRQNHFAFKGTLGQQIQEGFKHNMGKFVKNAVERGEIEAMPIEVYWSIAYAPLYSLLRFHNEGRSLAGKKFVMNDKIMWQTFDLVVKALRK